MENNESTLSPGRALGLATVIALTGVAAWKSTASNTIATPTATSPEPISTYTVPETTVEPVINSTPTERALQPATVRVRSETIPAKPAASPAVSTPPSIPASAPAVTPSPTPTPTPTPAKASFTYRDGTYESDGTYFSPDGQELLGVSITLSGDTVASAQVTPKATAPASNRYEEMFRDGFSQFVVGKPIDQISLTVVNGSSLTPKGFMDALAKIKLQARS